MKEFSYNVAGAQSFDDAKREFLNGLTDDERRMEQSFEQQTRVYKGKYIEYFSRKIDSSKILDDVTQPYYQSMILSRKRLEQKNISIDIDMKTNSLSDRMPFKFKNDEKFYVGERQDALKINRTFRLNGKKIRKQKSKETSKITFLKSMVDSKNGEAVCPNCGYSGKLSSYLDGCDACGSVYSVNDFEPKVAGFALQENRVSKFYGAIFNAFKLFLLTWMAFIILLGVSNGIFGVASCVMPSIYSSIVTVIVTLVLISKMSVNIWNTVENEDIVKRGWRWFSTDDFLQNLEYKIKNIHMASDVKEVSSFARCGLNEVVHNYQNVIDCDVTHVKFKDIGMNTSGYQLDFSAIIRLIEMK